jgi:hypothetical protein
MAQIETSPLTGILLEDQVFLDFGVHEGKSILEIGDVYPEYYNYLMEEKDGGNFAIRRCKEKIYRLYVHEITYN